MLYFPDKAEFTSDLRPRGHLLAALNGETDKALSLIITEGAKVLRIVCNRMLHEFLNAYKKQNVL